jgi:uncharacterized cupin superfamily protein
MKARILNIEKVSYQNWSHGKRYKAEIGWVGAALGSRKLGFNVTLLPPGKSAFPYHVHHANEELFFVLEGRGRIRIGKASHEIRKGDFISLPPGPGSGHQIVNNSKAPLRYIAVSTMESPEVAEYPESGKLGVFTGVAPGRRPSKGSMRHYARVSDGVGYWDGE